MSEISTTSSIGAAWPPEGTTQQRHRGFFDLGVLSNPDDVSQFAEHYSNALDQMRADPEASRLSIRAVTTRQMVAELEQQGVPVEGAIPFCAMTDAEEEQGARHPGLAIAYVGENTAERNELHIRSADIPFRGPNDGLPKTQQELLTFGERSNERLARAGLEHVTFQELSGGAEVNEDMVQGLSELWLPLGYDESQAQSIVLNPNNHIVVGTNEQGRVVTAAMAEVASIRIHGLGRIIMAEITEASTLPEYRGNGLYRVGSGLVVSRLGETSLQGLMPGGSGPIHVIYGESNMVEPGVLRAAQQNGRYFSNADVDLYDRDGMLFNYTRRRREGRMEFGVLPRNFRIGDRHEDEHNDFALSYVSFGGLQYLQSDAFRRYQR